MQWLAGDLAFTPHMVVVVAKMMMCVAAGVHARTLLHDTMHH